jgi:5-methylcytosine-specific restriction endonuclease McrA
MVTEQIIRPLFEQGLRNKDIQELLKASSYVVSYWRKKLGFPKTYKHNEPKKYDWDKIQEDHTNGLTERQLSKKYGLSTKTIYDAKKTGKLIPRPFVKKWKTYKQYRATVNEANARYRARLKNQVVEGEDLIPIKQFYENCPPGYEVDHIIPLSKGGLHTISNLQYLTVTENRKKSNKIVGD